LADSGSRHDDSIRWIFVEVSGKITGFFIIGIKQPQIFGAAIYKETKVPERFDVVAG